MLPKGCNYGPGVNVTLIGAGGGGGGPPPPLRFPAALKPHDRVPGDSTLFRITLLSTELFALAVAMYFAAQTFPASSRVTAFTLFLLAASFWLLNWEVRVYRARKRRE